VFPALRRGTILDLVQSNGAVSLRELTAAVETTEVTVRRDLRALEPEGLLARRHGGAVLPNGLTHELSYSQKARVCGQT